VMFRVKSMDVWLGWWVLRDQIGESHTK